MEQNKSNFSLKLIGLVVVLGILGVRATCTEGLGGGEANLALMNFIDVVKSLSLSMVLLAVAIIGLLMVVWGKVNFKFGFMELGIGIFFVGAVISSFLASDVRTAITSSLILMAAMLAGVLIVNLADGKEKVRLVLVVLTGLGVLNSLVCMEQFWESNDQLIRQYEEDPGEILSQLGIEEGTLEEFMLEHRLYSKDVKGYFLTGNSAGSFFILAGAGCAMLVFESWRLRKGDGLRFLCTVGAFLIILAGLVLTRSKGAIGGVVIAAAAFGLYRIFGKYLKNYRLGFLVVILAAVLLAGLLLIWYGIENDRLPGGNSMLVRWQYWDSSAEMVKDHPFGVGGGGFGTFYPRYKNPASPETVSDPHNFILSLLSQYGWIGLAGFFAAAGWPMMKVVLSRRDDVDQVRGNYMGMKWFVAVVVLTGLAMAFCKGLDVGGDMDLAVLMILIVYILPLAILFFGGFLLWPRSDKLIDKKGFDYVIPICGVIGFGIHNLIDFAIFEPGVWLGFWILVGVIVACWRMGKGYDDKPLKLSKGKRIAASIVAVGVYVGMFLWGYLPAARTSALLDETVREYKKLREPNLDLWGARQGQVYGENMLKGILAKLEQGCEIDKFDPTVCEVRGKFAAGSVGLIGFDREILVQGRKSFEQAIERDRHNFKHYENLAEIYILLSRIGDERKNLGQALENLVRAVDLYPGSGRLQYKLASVADKLGENLVALEHYSKAVEIEQAFEGQFKEMYPGLDVVSRLGKERYKRAVERTEELTE